MLHRLCADALHAGAVRQQQRISPALVEEVIAELRGKSRSCLVRWAEICTAGLLVAGVVWRAVKELNVSAPAKAWRHRLMHYSRRAVVAGLVTCSLLGVGVVWQSPLLGKKLREYTAASVPSPPAVSPPRPVREGQPLIPQRPVWREQPILPLSSGLPGLSRRVQWQQTTISYQLPLDKPFVVPLPPLQYTPDN